MRIAEETITNIRTRYEQIRAELDERRRRLWAGNEALALGHGGIRAVRAATGMSVNTIRTGQKEILASRAGEAPLAAERNRRSGAGRKRLEDKDPELEAVIERLVAPATRGDPTSGLRWSAKSTTKLAAEATAQGHPVSPDVVGRLLKKKRYSLQSTRKRFEGKQHPDRDAQFNYISKQIQQHQEQGHAVVSVDAKKKEQIGNFGRKGQDYQPQGQPIEVEAYDFASLAEGKVAPYGVYDLEHNEGWVSVGMSADTAEFSVNSILRWWQVMGKQRYPGLTELVVTADCGGSNGNRTRLWKFELQDLSNLLGIPITVLHYPPGTSKWNRIEHRLFNHLTNNLRGRPLTSLLCVVEAFADTKTATGLHVRVEHDPRTYKTGIRVDDEDFKRINIKHHQFHGEWNYTISPQKDHFI